MKRAEREEREENMSDRLIEYYIKWLTEKVNNDDGLKEQYCDSLDRELSDEECNNLFRIELKVKVKNE